MEKKKKRRKLNGIEFVIGVIMKIELLQIYDKIKKEKPNRYISPVEIIIMKIETDISSKGFVRIGLTEEDLIDLRKLPMFSIGRDSDIKVYDIQKNVIWIRNYIKRKRPDLYADIVIFVKQDMIFIISEGLDVPERHLKK